MTRNLLQELDYKFIELTKQNDEYKFYGQLKDYFNYIENTHPFKELANNLFQSPTSMLVVRTVRQIYDQVLFNKKNNFIPINPENLSGSGVFVFHSQLVEKAKQLNLDSKQEIIIEKETGSQRVCLIGSQTHCYKPSKNNSKRFKIILILLRSKTGKTAEEIQALLDKSKKNGKVAQQNIKDDIKEINKKFSEDCFTNLDLISYDKSGNKNRYFLNRNSFKFN